MTAEFLKALGIEGDSADKIIAQADKEVNDVNIKYGDYEDIKSQLAVATANAKDLSEKVKTFDGIDVDELKKSAANWEKKYNDDMAAAKLDAAVELALTKAGAKDAQLAKHLIDTSLLKLDDGKVVGLTEQLEKAKSEKAFLFGADEPTHNSDTGINHGSTAEIGITDTQIRSVMGLDTSTSK